MFLSTIGLKSVDQVRTQSSGMRHTIRLLWVPAVVAPVLSRAGVKRARRVSSRQVAESSAEEPLDDVTVQLVTRPSAPTSSRNPVVPASPERSADGG